jgi:invasion protein IalB
MKRAIVALWMGLSIGTAAAQERNVPVTSGAGWRVECTNGGKSLDCRAVAQIVQQDNNQLVAALVVRVPPETKKPVMMLQLPLGISVNAPVSLAAGGASQSLTIQTCTPAGCFAGAPVTQAMIGALRSQTQLRIVFENLDKGAVTVSLPLAGFSAAYDKVK